MVVALNMTARDRRNWRRSVLFFVVHLACWILALVVIRKSSAPVGWVAAALSLCVGIAMLFAYRRFLREADELQRTIHLQALALGFGGCIIASMGYRLIERLGAPPADIMDSMRALFLFFWVGIIWGNLRYR